MEERFRLFHSYVTSLAQNSSHLHVTALLTFSGKWVWGCVSIWNTLDWFGVSIPGTYIIGWLLFFLSYFYTHEKRPFFYYAYSTSCHHVYFAPSLKKLWSLRPGVVLVRPTALVPLRPSVQCQHVQWAPEGGQGLGLAPSLLFSKTSLGHIVCNIST